MVDINKHIVHWKTSAVEDWDIAQRLIASNNIRHGLFFLHLTVEKLLKALVCRHTNDIAPRLHNLVRLAELSGILFTQEQIDLLVEINPLHIEGRYPDMLVPPASKQEAEQLQERTKELFIWLNQQLS